MKRVVIFILALILSLSATSILIGCKEESGASWTVNATAPTSSDKASVGDFWLDSSTADIYQYGSDGWSKTGSFAQSSQSNGSVWHKGEGEPDRKIGNKGDFYIDTKNKIVYEKLSLSWKMVCTLENDSTTVYVDEFEGEWYEDKTLKILAIGNSFSEDTMEYVYEMATEAYIDDVVIGNLYIGGCNLNKHYSNLVNNVADYKYYYEDSRVSDEQYTTENYSANTAIASQDWDFISLQQVSNSSGQPDSYSKLTDIVNIVKQLCPTAKLVWNMTWAYQSDSTHAAFPNYGNNQTAMYNAICSTVQSTVVPTGLFSVISPTGTAVQNARTSALGDNLTRDGYHLDKSIGRYIAGLTYFCALTGIDPYAVSYCPSSVNKQKEYIAKESAFNAIKTPYSVTKFS